MEEWSPYPYNLHAGKDVRSDDKMKLPFILANPFAGKFSR
jgi:hypothetical protein